MLAAAMASGRASGMHEKQHVDTAATFSFTTSWGPSLSCHLPLLLSALFDRTKFSDGTEYSDFNAVDSSL